MKKLLILFFLILSACSNNSPESPKEIPSEEVYNLDANGIGFFSGSPQIENDNRIDLSTVIQGQKKSLTVTIKNMGTAATPLLSASLSDTKFYITSSTCSNKSLPPNGGSCSLTLNFSAVSKALQVFESSLSFGPSLIPVKIEVVSSSGQTGGGSALIKMYDGSTLIQSPPDYSIGSVSGTAKLSKVITIKNEGTAATLIGDATLSSSSFYLTSNSCAGKALVVNGSCSVTVNFSGSGKTVGQSYPVSLSFAGSSVSLSASTQAPPAPAPAQLVFMDGSNILSQDLNLGQYSNNVTLSKTITVKNVGASSSSTLSLQLLNNPSGYFTVSNSCFNRVLAPNASCSFSLRVSTNKPAGIHSVELKLDQSSQIISFEKLGSSNSYTVTLDRPSVGELLKMISSGFYDGATYCGEPSSYHDQCDIQSSGGIIKLAYRNLPKNYSSGKISLSNPNLSLSYNETSIDNLVGFEITISGISSSQNLSIIVSPGPINDIIIENDPLDYHSGFFISGGSLIRDNSGNVLLFNNSNLSFQKLGQLGPFGSSTDSLSKWMNVNGYSSTGQHPVSDQNPNNFITNNSFTYNKFIGNYCIFFQDFGNSNDLVQIFSEEDLLNNWGISSAPLSDQDCLDFIENYYLGYPPEEDGVPFIVKNNFGSIQGNEGYSYITRIVPLTLNFSVIQGIYSFISTFNFNENTPNGMINRSAKGEIYIDQNARSSNKDY